MPKKKTRKKKSPPARRTRPAAALGPPAASTAAFPSGLVVLQEDVTGLSDSQVAKLIRQWVALGRTVDFARENRRIIARIRVS